MPDRDLIRARGSDNEKSALLIHDGLKALADALVESAKILAATHGRQ